MNQRTIAFVLFPGVTLLDLVGPLQVLTKLGAGHRSVVVGSDTAACESDSGLKLHAEAAFADVSNPQVVLVPGGPGSVAAMADARIQEYLRLSSERAELITSVCTGSLILAAAGLLEGRRATTHWAYAKELEMLGATYVRERWVEDGKFVTAAGVSAGIDLGLALAARLTDRATAEAIQLGMEYDPQPPFGGIDWQKVGEAQLQRQRRAGTGAQLDRKDVLLADRPDLLERLTSSSVASKRAPEGR